MDKTFNVELRTPEKLVFSGDVTSITAPGANGSFQILIGHRPFMTTLLPGKMTIREAKGDTRSILVDEGIFEVLRSGVTALVDSAKWLNSPEK